MVVYRSQLEKPAKTYQTAFLAPLTVYISAGYTVPYVVFGTWQLQHKLSAERPHQSTLHGNEDMKKLILGSPEQSPFIIRHMFPLYLHLSQYFWPTLPRSPRCYNTVTQTPSGNFVCILQCIQYILSTEFQSKCRQNINFLYVALGAEKAAVTGSGTIGHIKKGKSLM